MPNQNGLFIALRFGGAMTIGAAGTYLLLKRERREYDDLEKKSKVNAELIARLEEAFADEKNYTPLNESRAASSSNSFGSANTHISSESAKSKRASSALSKRASYTV